jgi:hypothetical protein
MPKNTLKSSDCKYKRVKNKPSLSMRLLGAKGTIQILTIRYMRNHRHENKVMCSGETQRIENYLYMNKVHKLQCKQKGSRLLHAKDKTHGVLLVLRRT